MRSCLINDVYCVDSLAKLLMRLKLLTLPLYTVLKPLEIEKLVFQLDHYVYGFIPYLKNWV